ncbi:MAG TPA: zinc ribbon domain-containing protein [Ktedonobacterales bacterium]|nr:zinc ribbon domain-containing protein [Ktedonobacterales bacterium]
MSSLACPRCGSSAPSGAPTCPACGAPLVLRSAGPVGGANVGPAEAPPATVSQSARSTPSYTPPPLVYPSAPSSPASPPPSAAMPVGPMRVVRQATPTNVQVYATSKGRAVAATAGIAVLMIVAAVVLWRTFTAPDPEADAAFFRFMIGSHSLSPVPAGDTYLAAYDTMMFLLLAAAPLVAAAAYWFGLRRLYQDHGGAVWLKTLGLSVGLTIAAIGVLSVGVPRGDMRGPWALAMFAYYPAFLLLALIAATAAGTAAYGFVRWFARFPLERMRLLQSDPWLDVLLVGGIALGALAAQFVVYGMLAGSAFASGIWWVPLAALLLATYAGWAALRPLPNPQP